MDVDVPEENVHSIFRFQGLNPSTLNITRCQNTEYHKPEFLLLFTRETQTNAEAEVTAFLSFTNKMNCSHSSIYLFYVILNVKSYIKNNWTRKDSRNTLLLACLCISKHVKVRLNLKVRRTAVGFFYTLRLRFYLRYITGKCRRELQERGTAGFCQRNSWLYSN
jgi:hypothetical protein